MSWSSPPLPFCCGDYHCLSLAATRPRRVEWADPTRAWQSSSTSQILWKIFSLPELRKIFLGEGSHWPNGRRITVVMMDLAHPERKVILREIYGMNEKDLNNHFIQGVFTGAVLVSPKTLGTPAEVLKFVFNVPGAIGYVRASEVDGSVKILRVDGRLPDDKDYSLRMQPRVGKP
jgi:hypothetical protein